MSKIDITGKADWEIAILMQELGDMGYETFVEEDGMLCAYIQTALVEKEADKDGQDQPWPYPAELCPDENWNAAWEEEHPAEEVVPGVWIVPHCAFGAGHHETTRMMASACCAWSKDRYAEGVRSKDLNESAVEVLDMGCGTGVLGIVAAKMTTPPDLPSGGRERTHRLHVTMVDIDDKSVENTRENIELNGLPMEQFTLLCQGTVPEGEYDLILANIHRNILLAQMADYARYLKPGGRLQMSGFYEADATAIVEAARECGLTHVETVAEGEWRMVVMKK